MAEVPITRQRPDPTQIALFEQRPNGEVESFNPLGWLFDAIFPREEEA